ILGRYLDMPPAQLEFRSGPNGKPDLAASRGRPALRFNLSHAQDLALYAVTLRREVGVDAERVSHDFVDRRLAERFFCPRGAPGPGYVAALAIEGVAGRVECWQWPE